MHEVQDTVHLPAIVNTHTAHSHVQTCTITMIINPCTTGHQQDNIASFCCCCFFLSHLTRLCIYWTYWILPMHNKPVTTLINAQSRCPESSALHDRAHQWIQSLIAQQDIRGQEENARGKRQGVYRLPCIMIPDFHPILPLVCGWTQVEMIPEG